MEKSLASGLIFITGVNNARFTIISCAICLSKNRVIENACSIKILSNFAT